MKKSLKLKPFGKVFRWIALPFFCLVGFLPMVGSAAGKNLIENGDFEKGSGWPSNWGEAKPGQTAEKDGANQFVRMVATVPDQELTLYRAVKVEAGKAYELSFRVQVDNLKVGKELWFDARIVSNIKDDSGEKYPSPAPVVFRKNTGKWVEKSIKFKIPENATKLEIIAGLFKVEAGTFEIDDLVLKEIDVKKVD